MRPLLPRRAASAAGAFLVASATLLGAAPTVLAAPPSNDTSGGAVAATIGFSDVVDTSEATTDAEDAQLNASCGAPATDASVWYTIVGTDAGVVVDVSASNYSAGVLVGVGSPGSLETVACGPGTVGFFADAGTTYYVLAIDDQQDGGGNGGSLSISFAAIPPPPTIDFTVDKYGTFNSKTGTATVSGSYTCTNGDFIEVDVEARQVVGRLYVLGSGSFFDSGTCDGSAHRWSAEIFPFNGVFKGGKSLALSFAFACGVFDCSDGFIEATVPLRGR